MDKRESIENCQKIVREFLIKYCNNDLTRLLSFDIGAIEERGEFGKPKEYNENWSMDPDDSIVARAVLYLLYNDKIEDLTFDKIGTEYRGDTIFTPGNIFGKKMEFLEKQDIVDKCTYTNKVNMFLEKYHTIPNMMLLPNKKIEVVRKNRNGEYISTESLNQYRGMNSPGLSDYIDLFIQEIYNYIENINTAERDRYIAELFQTNAFYFNTFNKGIQFLESHFLDDIVCKVENTYEIINDYKFEHVVWWKITKDYDVEIDKFLDAFERLWIYRKEKMLSKLQKCLVEN